MADNNFFGHGSSDGERGPFDRGDEQGVFVTGENVAAGTATGIQVRLNWRDSETHCNTMMRTGHKLGAVARAYSASSTLKYYWVESFADRLEGFDDSCHESFGEPEPSYKLTTTPAPSCPDPTGGYLAMCNPCIYNAQCPMPLYCDVTKKVCAHPVLRSAYCRTSNANCDSGCVQSAENYPDSCQCGNEDFPANWMDCPEQTTTEPIVVGEWSSWGGWTECSKSCDLGYMRRSRMCINGDPTSCSTSGWSTQTEILNCNEFECSSVTEAIATTNAPTAPETTDSPSIAPVDPCGDSVCDQGEMTSCPQDCVAEITTAVCECARNHNLCGETCPATLSINDDKCQLYGATGICGGIIPTDSRYYEICGESCPTQPPTYAPTYADCTSLEGTEDQIRCLQNKIEVLSARCQANTDYQESCATIRDDISSMLSA